MKPLYPFATFGKDIPSYAGLAVFFTIPFFFIVIVTMRHHVDGNCNSQDEDVILPGLDLHPVSVCQAEPFL